MSIEQRVRYSEIQRQHEVITDDLARLRAVASDTPAPPPNTDRHARLVEGIIRLHRDLRKHFELEEDGGYLDAVIAKRPELSRRVVRLQEHHGEVLVALERLEHDSDEGAPLEELTAGVLRVLDLISKHEEEEINLMQQALLEDIGGSE